MIEKFSLALENERFRACFFAHCPACSFSFFTTIIEIPHVFTFRASHASYSFVGCFISFSSVIYYSLCRALPSSVALDSSHYSPLRSWFVRHHPFTARFVFSPVGLHSIFRISCNKQKSFNVSISTKWVQLAFKKHSVFVCAVMHAITYQFRIIMFMERIRSVKYGNSLHSVIHTNVVHCSILLQRTNILTLHKWFLCFVQTKKKI